VAGHKSNYKNTGVPACWNAFKNSSLIRVN